LRVGFGYGSRLEARGSEPLVLAGSTEAIEAALSVPGGSTHAWELGVRAAGIGVGGGAFELGALVLARVDLIREPGWLGLLPLLRGGLELGARRLPGENAARALVGPCLGVGFERALGGGSESSLVSDSS
jgi:hypothetical protein